MPNPLEHHRDYALVICEKPDAARRVAEALGDGRASATGIGRVQVFAVERDGRPYVICSASGHLYTVADPSRIRYTYPIYDVEWYPAHLVEKKNRYVEERIRVIQALAKRARAFIHACDFDLEGETIGYNVLRYACGGKQGDALRAKFSTLTTEELQEAFASLQRGLGSGLAEAGRTRHVVDFIWGVNLSRALSEAFYAANNRYKMVSMGRVQGPTLRYVVEREVAIRCFVPTPYWTISAVAEKDGTRLLLEYEESRIEQLARAEAVKSACEGKTGAVASVRKSIFRQSPPTPFNIGDLQREAYRVFGFSPSQTLGIAERLYLDALISYPRTSSQKLPPSINYKKIMSGLSKVAAYRDYVRELLAGSLKPYEGVKEDPAHPAVYPTGERSKRALDPRENKLYDLVVRRFFAVFGREALRERVSAVVAIDSHNFKLFGRRTLEEGWLKYYRPYTSVEDNPLPPLEEGETLRVVGIDMGEKFEQPSSRYNQGSLLKRMEEEGIGTKTTRADIINTLYERRYIAEESVAATDVGFAVVEAMKAFSPGIISTEMTREVEKQLEEIEAGSLSGEEVIEGAVEKLADSLDTIKGFEVEIGRSIRQAVISTALTQNVLGGCPMCKTGKLTIIRSRKTRKRFVGCTSYSQGCRASAPLPQRGAIKATGKACPTCGWPVIHVRFTRIPWRICVNINCPSKEAKKREVPAVPKRRSGE